MIPYLPARRIVPTCLRDIGALLSAQPGRFPPHPGNMPLNEHPGAGMSLLRETERRKGFQVEVVYADQVQTGDDR